MDANLNSQQALGALTITSQLAFGAPDFLRVLAPSLPPAIPIINLGVIVRLNVQEIF